MYRFGDCEHSKPTLVVGDIDFTPAHFNGDFPIVNIVSGTDESIRHHCGAMTFASMVIYENKLEPRTIQFLRSRVRP